MSRRLATMIALLLLGGCTVGPNHTPPSISLPAKFAEGGSAGSATTAQKNWWADFNDPQLTALVADGMQQNLSIAKALERITGAEAGVTIAAADGLPRANMSATATTSRTRSNDPAQESPRTVTPQIGFGASWLLDIVGQYRRAKESALAEVDAAYADADVTRLSLISQIALAYVDLRYFQQRVALAKRDLASRRETFGLTQKQIELGAASRLDAAQAEGLVNSTRSDIPLLDIEVQRASHRIATLLGKPAAEMEAELLKPGRQPVARANVDAGVPADLVRNRPDIRAAERRLAAAVAEIGVAEAQLYPSIALGGSITPSFTAVTGGSNFNRLTWSFGPQLVLPILDGGRLKANVEAKQSAARERYIDWKQSVIGAIEEVENALAALKRHKAAVQALRDTVASYQQALDLSRQSYRDGAASLLDLLDAERQLSAAQANLTSAIQETARDYVTLNVAIGGGYGADLPTTAGTANTVAGGSLRGHQRYASETAVQTASVQSTKTP